MNKYCLRRALFTPNFSDMNYLELFQTLDDNHLTYEQVHSFIGTRFEEEITRWELNGLPLLHAACEKASQPGAQNVLQAFHDGRHHDLFRDKSYGNRFVHAAYILCETLGTMSRPYPAILETLIQRLHLTPFKPLPNVLLPAVEELMEQEDQRKGYTRVFN